VLSFALLLAPASLGGWTCAISKGKKRDSIVS